MCFGIGHRGSKSKRIPLRLRSGGLDEFRALALNAACFHLLLYCRVSQSHLRSLAVKGQSRAPAIGLQNLPVYTAGHDLLQPRSSSVPKRVASTNERLRQEARAFTPAAVALSPNPPRLDGRLGPPQIEVAVRCPHSDASACQTEFSC